MNKYEMMFIVKSTLEEAKIKEVANKLKDVITSMNGEVTNVNEIGNKKLAYEINKEVTGYYYVYNFNANNELVAELDRVARINENVVRHMIIRLDEE